jgi:hypothetical protein
MEDKIYGISSTRQPDGSSAAEHPRGRAGRGKKRALAVCRNLIILTVAVSVTVIEYY